MLLLARWHDRQLGVLGYIQHSVFILFFSILSLCFHDSKWSESVNLVDTQFYW